MRFFGGLFGQEKRSLEDPSYKLSDNPEALLSLLGVLDRNNSLPLVSIEAALQVPTVWSITNFLPRTLAVLPLHTFEAKENGERVDDNVSRMLSFAPNEEMTSYSWRLYHWHQVFTGGRGLSWIERSGDRVLGIWPIDPTRVTVLRRNGRKLYRFDGKEYPARDIIDTPFMLKPDQIGSYGPIAKCNKAISLAIAMGDFAGGFFGGGGVPPLALEGPMPSGAEAAKRAKSDIDRAIDLARKSNSAMFNLPPGYKLNPVGIDPSKGQMVDARLFQVQEMARGWQMPPVFVGDLSKGTFSNTEQQDLQLVKHLIGQWAKSFEDEVSLKVYGWRNPIMRARHNLDGLQRGAFKDRVEALARAILTGQMTPDEARALENRPPDPNGQGGKLYVQQATVPLGTLPQPSPSQAQNSNTTPEDPKEDDADAGDSEN